MEATYEPVSYPNRPVWLRPVQKQQEEDNNKLVVHNSLTESVEEFVPHEGRRVRWYTCGPTVYDVCHMGHARAYLTFDILRRIMTDYLHYDVEYHVNITDVDDKIILRARRNHLLDEYVEKNPSREDVLTRSQATLVSEKLKLEEKLASFVQELATTSISGKRKSELEEQVKVVSLKLNSTITAQETISATATKEEISLPELVKLCSDPLGVALDAEFGSQVCDNKIFEAHARKYEELFLIDMQRLGVRPPDVLTRVTEYVPKIIQYCEILVQSGFAYISNGSVYLDTKAFEHSHHTYRKLKPFTGETSKEELEESEGALCHSVESEKKDPTRDFVLWKKSKLNTGEPGWESPWGRGRPGWHIECSVVASDVLGKTLDIHAGGEDLKFPHHDNELAQSEAFHNCQQWVNYFFHAGHLHIKGLKMSKSLKNFVTIDEALKYSTPRRLRMLFLIQPWDGSFTYSDDSLDEAKSKEKRFGEFLGNVKSLERELIRTWVKRDIDAPTTAERKFTQLLYSKRAEAHKAILNNFNTPQCLQALSDIVDGFYAFKDEAKDKLAYPICIEAGRYVAKILGIFGVDFIGGGGGEEDDSQASREAVITPFVEDLIAFRHEIKNVAYSSSGEVKAVLLKACDKLRDETLVERGVSVQDDGGKVVWKLRDAKELKAEIAEAKQKDFRELEEKRNKQVKKALEEVEEMEMVLKLGDGSSLSRTAEFTEWDENGVPTKDAQGQPVSKNAFKKMNKDRETQAGKLERLIAASKKAGFQSPSEYISLKRTEIEAMKSGAVVSKKASSAAAASAPLAAPPTNAKPTPKAGDQFSYVVAGDVYQTMISFLKDKTFSSVAEYVAFINSQKQ